MSKQQISININNLKQYLLIGGIVGAFFLAFFGGKLFVKDSSKNELSNTTLSVNTDSKPQADQVANPSTKFLGDPGETLISENNNIYIVESKVADGNMHSFNYFSDKVGKSIYFFIVKASDGTYRAAANACEVCHESKKGFKQVGNQIRCENCQITYSKDSIALEKGGCNPGPINKDVPVEAGKLVLKVTDIEGVANLF